MSSRKEKKKRLFLQYSKNLSLLFDCFQANQISIPEEGRYVCPIAFTVHDINTLNEGSNNQLDLEHFPPESLGGKNTCLVRKDINSKMGSTVDKKLLQHIMGIQFLKGKSSHPSRISFNLHSLKHVHAKLSILQGSNTDIIIEPGKKNMKLIEKEIINKNLWNRLRHQFEISFIKLKDKEIKIACLRYAYLMAFKTFGYALLFGPKYLVNPHYKIVRRQILNPNEEIIPFIPAIKSNNPPYQGISIVAHPEKMKSILVTFPLTLNKITDYYTIFLPAPDNRGFAAYDFFKSNIGVIENINLKMSIIKPFNICAPKKNVLALYRIWGGLNKLEI